eukprot:g26507.t1
MGRRLCTRLNLIFPGNGSRNTNAKHKTPLSKSGSLFQETKFGVETTGIALHGEQLILILSQNCFLTYHPFLMLPLSLPYSKGLCPKTWCFQINLLDYKLVKGLGA